jgi:hypothetical protein
VSVVVLTRTETARNVTQLNFAPCYSPHFVFLPSFFLSFLLFFRSPSLPAFLPSFLPFCFLFPLSFFFLSFLLPLLPFFLFSYVIFSSFPSCFPSFPSSFFFLLSFLSSSFPFPFFFVLYFLLSFLPPFLPFFSSSFLPLPLSSFASFLPSCLLSPKYVFVSRLFFVRFSDSSVAEEADAVFQCSQLNSPLSCARNITSLKCLCTSRTNGLQLHITLSRSQSETSRNTFQ